MPFLAHFGAGETEVDVYGAVDGVYGTSYFREMFLNIQRIFENFMESISLPAAPLEYPLYILGHFSRIFAHFEILPKLLEMKMDGYGAVHVMEPTFFFRKMSINIQTFSGYIMEPLAPPWTRIYTIYEIYLIISNRVHGALVSVERDIYIYI